MRFHRILLCLAGLASLLVTAPVAAQLGSRPAEEWIRTLDGPVRVAGMKIDATAELDLAARDADRAIERLGRAGRLGTPDLLESQAVALAAGGKRDEAMRRYEEVLRDPPLGLEAQEVFFQAHVALALLYEQAGRGADAERLYTALAKRWKDGDPDLPLLRQVRARRSR